MKSVRNMQLLSWCIAAGLASVCCATLNPHTDGHIVSALEEKQNDLKTCYVAALERDRETQGTIGLKLYIDRDDGQVTSSEVEDSNIADEAMHHCVATVALDMTLAEPPGVEVEAHYDVEFGFE